MLVDAATAKALMAVIMVSTQGADILNQQLPLEAVDRGDAWLIKGTPYTDELKGLQYCMCHLFIRKDSAEVTGIGCDGRQILTKNQKNYWSSFMTKADYARIFGPATQFEPNGITDFIYAAYGGLINKPADAIEYARVLMQIKPTLATIPESALQAKEDNRVWHVTTRIPGQSGSIELLSFSRMTGKLLSGNL
jgi:hypothetical protein